MKTLMLLQKSSQPRFEEPQIMILRRKNAFINFHENFPLDTQCSILTILIQKVANAHYVEVDLGK